MAITLSEQRLRTLLERMPAEQNIMLTGRHGIGKSEILTKFYQARGMKVVSLFLGQMSDPGDLIGLPHKDEKTGKTEFMPPYWFPTDNKPIVLFLDELNRARPEVLQTIMDLALNRKLAGKQLPKGSILISAVNDGEEYQLTDLDTALVSRFNIYAFAPTVAEWLLWADNEELDHRVTEFIRNHGEWLDGDTEKVNQYQGLEKSPDRRAWKKVSDFIKGVANLDDEYKTFIAGIVGVRATAAFFAALNEMKEINGKDVLRRFHDIEKQIAALQIHQLSIINEDIYRYIQVGEYDIDENIMIKNLTAYLRFLESRKEAMAHFASLLTDGLYPNASVFFALKADGIYQQLISFVCEL